MAETWFPTNSLERGLMFLELVVRRPGGLMHAEIRRWFNVPTSTCSYILSRLEWHGYLKKNKTTRRYEAGLKLAALAYHVPRHTPLHPILEAPLRELVEATHLTAAVGVLRRGRVLLVENVDTPEPLRVNLTVGSELPFDTTALGRVLIAWFSRRQLAALIEEYGLSKSTSRSTVTPSKLLQQLEVVRREGYANNETTVGARSVAVPILDGQDRVCAALVAMGATALNVWKRFHDLVERLKATAKEISELTRTVDWQHLS